MKATSARPSIEEKERRNSQAARRIRRQRISGARLSAAADIVQDASRRRGSSAP
jgi:hypothetical protein